MSDSSGLRQRRPVAVSKPPPVPTNKPEDPATAAPHPTVATPSSYLGVFLALCFLAISIAALRLRDFNLTPAEVATGTHSVAAAYRTNVALSHLRIIAAKPRWTGSASLDRSMEYIRDVIQNAATQSKGAQVEVEIATASGSHSSSIGTTQVLISYSDIQLVVARISPPGFSGDNGSALLINVHVDSAFGSPGASDNVAGVAIALEVLTSLLRVEPHVSRLSRPVVFLFNGAEEPLLAGADGFLKTHRWGKKGMIAAHINLESVGSGNAYALFQLGSGHAWLARAFGRAVKKPWGTVAGTEIFEKGVIPGETDYRIFNEAGIPGYDLALIENGHVYHTIYDDVKHVSRRCLQSGGQSLLIPLVLELAGEADAIGKHLRGDVKAESVEKAAFFDVLGFFFLVYPAAIGTIAGVIILLTAVSLLAAGGRRWQPSGTSDSTWTRTRMFGALVTSCLAGFLSATVTALFYVYVLERPLSWYGSVRFALTAFIPPFVIGGTTALQYSLPDQACNMVTYYNMLHATCGFYSLVVLFTTAKSLMSGFAPITMLATCLFAAFGPLPVTWVGVRTLLFVLPLSTVGIPTMYDGLGVLLSIFGRSGVAPSDVLASLLISVYTCFYVFVPLLAPLAYAPAAGLRLRKYAIWIAVLTGLLVAMLEELTLPHRSHIYSKDAPKRVIAAHFYAPQQSPSNVLGLVPLDVVPVDINTTVRMLPFNDKDILPKNPVFGALNSTIGESCRPFAAFLGKWNMFKVDAPLDLAVPTAEVKEVEEYNDDKLGKVARVAIEIFARDSMQITLRAQKKLEDAAIYDWSFDGPMRDMGDNGGAWVRHIGRGNGAERLRFSVVVSVNPATGKRSSVVFDVTSSRPGKSRSKVLEVLYFPQWSAPVYVQSTGASFSL